MAYIPDLFDNGIDILNPVQISAKGMDPEELKTQFGGRMSFWVVRSTPSMFAAARRRKSAAERAPESGDIHTRRRLRVQQRPQHPSRHPSGKYRRHVRRGL